MRRAITILALALFLLGCYSAGSSGESAAPTDKTATPSDQPSAAPSGVPADLTGYGGHDMTCHDQWVEGWLRTDVVLHNRLLNFDYRATTAIELSPLESGAWPEPSGLGYPVRFMEVKWPIAYTGKRALFYSGVRLAGGEVAVLDSAGALVAVTGSKYRLKGEWAMMGAVGGPWFGKGDWIDGFDVCLGSDSVIRQ